MSWTIERYADVEEHLLPQAPSPPDYMAVVHLNIPHSMIRNAWDIVDFELGQLLHKSRTSCLYSAIDKRTSTPVAIKAYNKDIIGANNTAKVLKEVSIHLRLNHPNIIQLYAAFHDHESLYLVLELATGGDLRSKLIADHELEGMTEQDLTKCVLGPLISALHYLHQRNILHCNIKPENICFTADNQVKIIDFGLAIDTSKEWDCQEDGEDLSPAVDIWFVGVLAYKLLTGSGPFGLSFKSGLLDLPSHISPSAA